MARTQEDSCDLLGAERTSVGMAGKSLHRVLTPLLGYMDEHVPVQGTGSSGEHRHWGWEGRGRWRRNSREVAQGMGKKPGASSVLKKDRVSGSKARHHSLGY